MNKEVLESINFLVKEFKRLKKKKEIKTLSKTEEETLKQLSSFLGEQK